MRPTPFILLFSLVAAMPVFSQALSTGNQYVTARVESMSGLVTIRAIGVNAPLTGAQKSFLYVMVGDRIFTNNNVGVNIQTDPRFGGLLLDGANQKIGDTVRTIWSNKQGCDIIQDVYPVRLVASGQIVIKWKVKNNSPNTPIWGQAQFLLDINNHDGDAGALLTRYGYRPIWEYYTDASTYRIPPFYASFEHKLPNAPTYETGTVGLGYTQDGNYSLGLKKPAQLTVGGWGAPFAAALVDFLWGISSTAPWGVDYQDPAVLLQWEGLGIGGNKTAELARTSYGTSELGICNSDLYLGVVFYPPHFNAKGSGYEPDTGVVEFYAFNKYSPIPTDPNYGPPSAEMKVTLQTGANIRILSPTPDNIEQTEQQQLLGPAAGYIPQYGVGTAFWRIISDKAIGCVGKVDSWLKFYGNGKWYGGNQYVYSDTCTQPLTIDCITGDTLPPVVSNIVTTTSTPYHTTVDILDNRTLDTGIDTITWIPSPGTNTNPSKFKVEVTVLLPCSKEKHLARVTQLDTTAAGCFDFTISDCAGNETIHTICMTAHPTMPGPDTLRPEVVISRSQLSPNAKDPCNALCFMVTLNELRPNDSGLEKVEVLTPQNMTFVSTSPLIKGLTTATFEVCVNDSTKDASLHLRVYDIAGNYTDTVLCYQLISGSVAQRASASDIELIGNPASSNTTLRITLDEEQSIKLSILDMSGRVVSTRPLTLIPAGVTDVQIPLDELSAGTYYIVAEWDGRQYAKKLSVVK